MNNTLLPCPFCGGEAKITARDVEPQGDPWYGKNIQTFVICTNCGACLFDDYFHEGFADNHEAIAAWNRRADAVQVVRCVDCKYRELAKVNCKGYTICPASGMEITDDDFCSYGERKEDRK